MNLDSVTAVMRPRSEWEAVDFGARMIRRDASAIYRVWFAITLPLLALALLLIFFGPYPSLAALLYWWLEPVADGPILRIIARRLFGEDADISGALRSIPHLVRRNWIFLLTPYRFHLARSIAMPITQLEGLKGEARRSRAKILNLKILNYGIGVSATYLHLAMALYLGIVLIGFAFVPPVYQDSIGLEWMDKFWSDGGRSSAALSLAAVYIAQTALQPWFVGAGFGLYINCRTQLEAWDIEVAFRRMVNRRTKGLATAVSLAMIATMFAIPLFPVTVSAQDVAPETEETVADPGFSGYWSDGEIQPALKEVLARDALKTTRDISQWRAIDLEEAETGDDNAVLSWWIRQLQNFGRLLSIVIEFGLWILLVALLLLLFATRKRWLPYLQPGSAIPREIHRVSLAGGDLSAAELPNDISAEVLRLWQSGDKRKALSLLYRGSVLVAVTKHGVRLPPSATEGACLEAVGKQTGAEQSGYFSRVVGAWIRCAYAFDEPGDDTIQPLCREWARYFGEAT